MEKMTRRGFLRDTVPVCGALGWYFGSQGEEPPHAKSPTITEPTVEHRDARRYMSIRATVAMREMPTVLPQLWKEVFGWLGAQGVAPAGPPLLRFLVIDMPARMEIEVGVPVATALAGNVRIRAGALPAGRYATLVYTGVRNGIAANAALQAWAQKRGIKWQMRNTKKGTAWASRVEFSLTDPKREPDPEKWQTEVAYLVSETRGR